MPKKKTNLEILPAGHINRSLPWYAALCEEIGSTRVETTFNAQDILISGKLAIGGHIADHEKEVDVTALVQSIASDLKISERDLWYCYKFHKNYDEIRKLPMFQSKAVSWNKVKKLISEPEKHKDACTHPLTEQIMVCTHCGSKVSTE